MVGRPKKEERPSLGKELDKVEEQFNEFDRQVKEMTIDNMNKAPLREEEPQTKLSQKDLEKSKDIYLKPIRTISDKQRFNPKFKEKWEFDKKYVRFIAENKEVIGEDIEMWTHPYGGIPAEFWRIPVNKAVMAPRYVAEQIRRKKYHRLKTDNVITENAKEGKFFGQMVVDETVHRLNAEPVSEGRSIFVGVDVPR